MFGLVTSPGSFWRTTKPLWLPSAGGTLPIIYADFTTEGTSNKYYANGASYTSASAWITALSGAFARGSTAYRRNASGLLESVSSGVLRFQYDASNNPIGILMEPARTNLLLRSQEFDNASWTKTQILAFGSGSTADATTAPDGTSTADLITPNTVNAEHIVTQDVTVTVNQNFGISYYVKPNGYLRFRIRVHDVAASANLIRADYNTDLGTITTATAAGNGVYLSSSMTAVGNGWYLLTLAGKANTSGTTLHVRLQILDNTGTASYAGDGTSGAYFWGAQLEAGSFVTSYYPTTSGTAARSADTFYVGTGSVGSELTMYARFNAFQVPPTGYTAAVATVGNNAASFGADAYIEQTPIRYGLNSGGAPVNAASSVSSTPAAAKLAARIKTNDMNFCLNGTLGTQDTSCTLPASIDRLTLGGAPWSSSVQPIGTIQEIALFNAALTDAQMQALTA